MKISSPIYKIGSNYNKRIVLLSDIHFVNKKNISDLNKVLEYIEKIKPDYICIAGDIVDDKNILNQEYLVEWFKKLASITKIFICFGNHDFYYNHTPTESYDKELFNKIDRIKNIYVLDNKIHSEYGINFIGVTIPNEYYDSEDANELISFLNKKYPYLSRGYNIMLIHSPYQIANKKVFEKIKCHDDIDLILSGHMHGGLTFEFLKKILKGRGLLSPQKRFLIKYCYGKYRIDKTNIIISSGVSKLSKSHKVKVLNYLYRSEVTIIDI